MKNNIGNICVYVHTHTHTRRHILDSTYIRRQPSKKHQTHIKQTKHIKFERIEGEREKGITKEKQRKINDRERERGKITFIYTIGPFALCGNTVGYFCIRYAFG